MVAQVLGQAPQASFRLNAFRLQSRLDVMPTEENLENYYQMLLAEMETLALCPENGTSSLTTPTVKALQHQQGPTGGGKGERWPCCSWGILLDVVMARIAGLSVLSCLMQEIDAGNALVQITKNKTVHISQL